MPSGADDGREQLGLQRLRRALDVEAPHAAYPGELGEYASLLANRGREQAAVVFPTLDHHLATCSRCRAELKELVGQL